MLQCHVHLWVAYNWEKKSVQSKTYLISMLGVLTRVGVPRFSWITAEINSEVHRGLQWRSQPKRSGWVRKVGLPQPLRGRGLEGGLLCPTPQFRIFEKMKPILPSFHATSDRQEPFNCKFMQSTFRMFCETAFFKKSFPIIGNDFLLLL